jgi:hypothetical protein
MQWERIHSKGQACELQYKMPVLSVWSQLRSGDTVGEFNLTTFKTDMRV